MVSPDREDPVQLTMPARPEFGWVARRVVLAFANTVGFASSRLEELGVATGGIWEEAALAPGVLQATIRLRAEGGSLRMTLEGTGETSPSGPVGGWSSPVTAALVGHVARQATIDRSEDGLQIETFFDSESAK